MLRVHGSSEKKYKQALKISETADYLQDLEDCSEEDLNDIEVAILPPDEVDEVTDIEEGRDDDMGVIPVSDVTGQVEFSCTIDQTVYKSTTENVESEQRYGDSARQSGGINLTLIAALCQYYPCLLRWLCEYLKDKVCIKENNAMYLSIYLFVRGIVGAAEQITMALSRDSKIEQGLIAVLELKAEQQSRERDQNPNRKRNRDRN
ncbi:hypothetical protein EVAR_27300_1 [Eumeta japonica]|uniref:Uncharacterized protein n=1 Tax=Eumeta variegata TaxID=151549 RepID=A0A4C1UD73_EUMVA|nr:hypothetical protein EVAR_27300_1 [Eumeta japonica]